MALRSAITGVTASPDLLGNVGAYLGMRLRARASRSSGRGTPLHTVLAASLQDPEGAR